MLPSRLVTPFHSGQNTNVGGSVWLRAGSLYNTTALDVVILNGEEALAAGLTCGEMLRLTRLGLFWSTSALLSSEAMTELEMRRAVEIQRNSDWLAELDRAQEDIGKNSYHLDCSAGTLVWFRNQQAGTRTVKVK